MSNSITSLNTTFKQGSTTYYYSSLFFPKKMWLKVATLYAFVRIIDNLVDQIPPQINEFTKIVQETRLALQDTTLANTPYVVHFIHLANKHHIHKNWILAFIKAMEADIYKKTYTTYEELQTYMFGSAGVIGLCMARLLDLPKQAYQAAKIQGEAMQLINFIRDIKEDADLGRTYIPRQHLNRFGITNLAIPPQNQSDLEAFKQLIQFEIDQYIKLQKQAEQGYHFIPYRYRIPVATAANLYLWTANQISKNPAIVYQKKIKPSKIRVLLTLITTAFYYR
jgi:phytoene synthase